MDNALDTDSPDAAPFRVSRRLLLGGAAASAFLVACGSGDGESSSTDADAGDPAGSTAPGIAFGTYVLAQRFPQNVQEPGLQRLPISLATADGRIVSDGPDTLNASVDDADGNPHGIDNAAVGR